jgi:hypothetical protein
MGSERKPLSSTSARSVRSTTSLPMAFLIVISQRLAALT